MAMMTVDVVFPKLFCVCLLHLIIAPDVRNSLAMMKYVLNHKKVRGSLIDLTEGIFRDEIYFVRDV